MRLYYVIHDSHATRQTRAQRQEHIANWSAQPFARQLVQRRTGPNEQLGELKVSPTGEYYLGGLDVLDMRIRMALDEESRRIDGRFSLLQRQLELVVLTEFRAALPADDLARATDLSVSVVVWGDRATALTGIRSYLQANAAIWYT